MNTNTKNGKWILMLCIIATSDRTANWQGLRDAGIEEREEASKVGLTLGNKLACTSFSLLLNWTQS